MSQRVLTAHVPDLLARRVDALAERLDRPRGWIVAEALTRFVELEQERHQLTLEALADVDAGRTVAHGDVVRWAASLQPKSVRKR